MKINSHIIIVLFLTILMLLCGNSVFALNYGNTGYGVYYGERDIYRLNQQGYLGWLADSGASAVGFAAIARNGENSYNNINNPNRSSQILSADSSVITSNVQRNWS